MNFLDLVILAIALGAGWLGYQMGFVRRVASWAGLGLGIFVSVTFVDDVAHALRGQPPRSRLLAALGFFIVITTIGQGIGFAIGGMLHRGLGRRAGTAGDRADRVAGSAAGVVGVLMLLWLLIPALAGSPGWPARAVRGSAFARAIDRIAPSPPSEAEILGRIVGDETFPEVVNTLTSPDAGSPPANGVTNTVVTKLTRSTVKVEGVACDLVQQGTGFVVGPNLVVTNAHVVAGETRTRIETSDGRRLDTQLAAFDPDRDLAVLRVPGLDLPALPEADGQIGERGALFGHPDGGPLRESPLRISEEIVAGGTDITRTHHIERHVYVLAAVVAPGDSGAPVIDLAGHVLGVVFAYDQSRDTTAYALTRAELDAVLDPVLAGKAPAPKGTGTCLSE